MHKPFAIFDMDGTLIDSMPFWCNLSQEYLSRQGVSTLPEGLLDEIIPMTMSESAALFARRFSLPYTPEQICADMNALMEAHYRLDIPFKPSVYDYLSRLAGEGVRMCVASATARPLMHACLDRLGLLPFFDFLLSCEDLHTSKREPLIYLDAARRFGAAPCDVTVYEDSLHCVETARRAGFRVAAVYDAFSDASWPQICALADETIFFS